MLDERKANILRVLVETHIRVGEPVSSQSVVDGGSFEISPATARAEIAALEADGYVVQPHTSAGRIPTEAGYRYYVDHLTGKPLRSRTKVRIRGFFGSMHHELGRMLQQTSDLLAELTRYPAVVVGPGLGSDEIRGAHLIFLSDQVMMVVLVSNAGRVQQEVARLSSPVRPADVDAAEEILSQVFEHRTAVEAAEWIRSGALDLPREVGDVVEVALDTVVGAGDATADVYLGGTSAMTSIWPDPTMLRQVLALIEREAALLRLISAADGDPSIKIGDELALNGDVDLAVVSAGYEVAGGVGGRVGVLGPMRMDYGRSISVVREVRENLAESLGS